MKATKGIPPITRMGRPYLVVGDERFFEHAAPVEGSMPHACFDTSTSNPPSKSVYFHHLGVVIMKVRFDGKANFLVAKVLPTDAARFPGIAVGAAIKVPQNSVPIKNLGKYLKLSGEAPDKKAIMEVSGPIQKISYQAIEVGLGQQVEQVYATTATGSLYVITLFKS